MKRLVSTNVVFIGLIFGIFIPYISKSFLLSMDLSSELEQLRVFFHDEFQYTIPVHIKFGDRGYFFPDLIEATQIQLNNELKRLPNENISIILIDNLTPIAKPTQSSINEKNSTESNKYELILQNSDSNSVAVDNHEKKATLFYNLESVHSNDMPFMITQALLYHLLQPEFEVRPSKWGSFEHMNISLNLVIDKNLEGLMESLIVHLNTRRSTINSLFKELIYIANFTFTVEDGEKKNIGSPCIDIAMHIDGDNNDWEFTASRFLRLESQFTYFSKQQQEEYLEVSLIETIANITEIPQNPSQNIQTRVSAVKRYLIRHRVLGLIDSISQQCNSDREEQASFILSQLNKLFESLVYNFHEDLNTVLDRIDQLRHNLTISPVTMHV